MFPDLFAAPFVSSPAVACAPVGIQQRRRRHGGMMPMQYGSPYASPFASPYAMPFGGVMSNPYSAYGYGYGARRSVLGGIGVGGLLGALAGFTASSNPLVGIAGGLIGGTGGAILGGLFGLGNAHRSFC